MTSVSKLRDSLLHRIASCLVTLSASQVIGRVTVSKGKQVRFTKAVRLMHESVGHADAPAGFASTVDAVEKV
jgi:hypothetical protein